MSYAAAIKAHLPKDWGPNDLHRAMVARGLTVSPQVVRGWLNGGAPSRIAWAHLVDLLNIADALVIAVARTAGLSRSDWATHEAGLADRLQAQADAARTRANAAAGGA
jgi:hypothetical protein